MVDTAGQNGKLVVLGVSPHSHHSAILGLRDRKREELMDDGESELSKVVRAKTGRDLSFT